TPLHFLGLRFFTTTDEHVADRELAQTFLKQIREFVAGSDAVEIGGVFLLCLVEVETVVVRIVKEVSFDAPGFVVDLLPHRLRINVDLPAVELERTEAGLGWT